MPTRLRVGETVAFTADNQRHEGSVTAVHPEAGRMVAEVTTADATWLMTLHGDDPRRKPDALVEGVKAHALAHYEDGGWDVVVECWEDAQIAEHIEGADTVEEAVQRFEGVVSVWADQQADARNSVF